MQEMKKLCGLWPVISYLLHFRCSLKHVYSSSLMLCMGMLDFVPWQILTPFITFSSHQFNSLSS